MRLPRSRSLNRWSQFQQVRQDGRSHAGKAMVLGVFPLPAEDADREDLKIGFITTKRLGNAVARNRIRRRLRAIVQANPPRAGHHYVIVARYPAGRVSFQRLESEWRRLAGQAGVLAEDAQQLR